jgi:hypothetical protein
MHNLVGSDPATDDGAFAAAAVARGLPLVDALGRCVGAAACNAPDPSYQYTAAAAAASGGDVPPLACYSTLSNKNRYLGSWNFQGGGSGSGGGGGGGGKQVTAMHGWAVDRELDDGSVPGKPRGFSPSTVRFTMDGTQIPHLADILANATRPDLANTTHVPNLEHGFALDDLQVALPAAAWAGKHRFEVFDIVGGGTAASSKHPLSSTNAMARCLCDGVVCDCD